MKPYTLKEIRASLLDIISVTLSLGARENAEYERRMGELVHGAPVPLDLHLLGQTVEAFYSDARAAFNIGLEAGLFTVDDVRALVRKLRPRTIWELMRDDPRQRRFERISRAFGEGKVRPAERIIKFPRVRDRKGGAAAPAPEKSGSPAGAKASKAGGRGGSK